MNAKLSFGHEFSDRYTQYGEGLSPSIEFEEIPDDAKSLAVLLENISFEEKTGSSKVYWLIWNIPTIEKLPEDIKPGERVEKVEKAVQGNNSFEVIGYTAPGRYRGRQDFRLTVYALDKMLELKPGSRIGDLKQALKQHVVDKAVVRKGVVY